MIAGSNPKTPDQEPQQPQRPSLSLRTGGVLDHLWNPPESADDTVKIYVTQFYLSVFYNY